MVDKQGMERLFCNDAARNKPRVREIRGTETIEEDMGTTSISILDSDVRGWEINLMWFITGLEVGTFLILWLLGYI